MIQINITNFITIALIALVAMAFANFAQEKTGVNIPFLS